jgi:hypothetical protein
VTERQLVVAVIAGGTLLALFIAVVLCASLGFVPITPISNLQLPTI